MLYLITKNMQIENEMLFFFPLPVNLSNIF